MTRNLKKHIHQMLIESRVDVRAARAEISGHNRKPSNRKRSSVPDMTIQAAQMKGKSYG